MENSKLEINKNIKFPKEMIKDKSGVIHFIALGGIGMSGLAKFLLELGYNVSGSDIKDGPTMFSISAHGGTVYVGHNAENVGKAKLVIVSSAIKASNPEVIEAQRRNIPILHRSQLLEALMTDLVADAGKKQISIGISGTHGKTTTTGMTSLIFEDAKLNPSVVVGGQMPFLNTNSKLGKGGYFIAELDESDGTIEFYAPDISVITNLELDHPDHYKNGLNQILDTFESYINNLSKESKIIINADCVGNRQLLERINHPGVILYSTEVGSNAAYTVKNVSAKGLKVTADVYKNNEFIGEFGLGIPGEHNVSNALAALAVALECGIDFDQAISSLKRFTGMKRRFQVLGTANGAQIVDDYAHHPTELQATLRAAKSVVESNNAGRVVAVFQPHRYSRLENLWNDFVESFKDADLVYICDIYPAGEKPIENISSERLAKEIDHNNVHYVAGHVDKVGELIYSDIKPNDLVLTIGAGDITKLGSVLIEKIGLDRVIA